MTTSSKKPRRMARPASETKSAASTEPTSTVAPVKRTTKQDSVLALLQRNGGATLAAIVEATGWLPHTTRAAMTGLRKKGHVVARIKVDGGTRYSVAATAAQ